MNSNKDMALADIKRKLGYSHTQLMIKQSELFTLLHRIGEKSEEQLSKKDLYALINANINYMQAHNIYEYYARSYRELKFNHGDINNENSEN